MQLQAAEVGSWFEELNEPGSTWSPDNATVRIELPSDRHLRLGIQGYLSGSLSPNSDSLTVWLEWLDAPDRIAPGTQFDMSYASPPVTTAGQPRRQDSQACRASAIRSALRKLGVPRGAQSYNAMARPGPPWQSRTFTGAKRK